MVFRFADLGPAVPGGWGCLRFDVWLDVWWLCGAERKTTIFVVHLGWSARGEMWFSLGSVGAE